MVEASAIQSLQQFSSEPEIPDLIPKCKTDDCNTRSEREEPRYIGGHISCRILIARNGYGTSSAESGGYAIGIKKDLDTSNEESNRSNQSKDSPKHVLSLLIRQYSSPSLKRGNGSAPHFAVRSLRALTNNLGSSPNCP